MIRVLYFAAAALSLYAQPRQLTHAQLDTRAAAGGLENQMRALLASQPQPAWIGYSVPTSGLYAGECWNGNGVVRLEPPPEVFLLFRAEAGAVTQIRTVSPDCAIDAGGVPLHWLTGVSLKENAAWLSSLALRADLSDQLRQRAVHALSMTKGPEAVEVLASLARREPRSRVGRQALNALSRSRDPRALAFFEDVLRR